MSRKATFFEFSDTTKAKWERVAKNVSTLANIEADYDPDRLWTKDEMIELMITAVQDDGEEIVERLIDTYFERMKLASVYNGTAEPTLDLVYTEDGGCAYKWLRNNEIPAGFLNHVLNVVGGMPRLAFDYFTIMAKEYRIEELVTVIGAHKAMTLLLLSELFVRVNKAEQFKEDEFQFYIEQIHRLKEDIQSRITQKEITQFNSMMGSLLLTAGE